MARHPRILAGDCNTEGPASLPLLAQSASAGRAATHYPRGVGSAAGLRRCHFGARPAMACVHVLDPLDPGTVLERVTEPPKLGGALVRGNLDVRELRRHDDETKDRGGRQVRHGERLTDEIAARADV